MSYINSNQQQQQQQQIATVQFHGSSVTSKQLNATLQLMVRAYQQQRQARYDNARMHGMRCQDPACVVKSVHTAQLIEIKPR